MKIAIASQNWLTVTNHPGKTGRFRVFEVASGHGVREVERLELPVELHIHTFKGDDEHPLYGVDVIIAGTAGTGFISRMAARGVMVEITSEKDPMAAITQYLNGTLPAASPHHH